MEPEHPDTLGHLVVPARDEPAVPERKQVLRGEEAERRADSGARDARRTEGLRRVLEQRQAEASELLERRRPAEQVHRHDRLRAGRDARGDLGGVEVERDRVDVGEHRSCPGPGNRLGRGVERERGADDLVAGADPHCLEREDERVRAVRDADRMRDIEVGRRLALERLDLGPEDEPSGLEHRGEALLELGDEGRVLRLHVDERDHDARVYRPTGAEPAGRRPRSRARSPTPRDEPPGHPRHHCDNARGDDEVCVAVDRLPAGPGRPADSGEEEAPDRRADQGQHRVAPERDVEDARRDRRRTTARSA